MDLMMKILAGIGAAAVLAALILLLLLWLSTRPKSDDKRAP